MKTGDGSSPRSAVASLVIAVVFFASIPVFLKYFTQTLDAWTVNGVRYVVAALFWLPFVMRRRHDVPAGKNVWVDALAPACVNICGQTLFNVSAYFNDASVVGFVPRCSFLFAIVFGFLLLRDERRLAGQIPFWIGVIAVAMGLVTIYRGGAAAGSTSPKGLALLLATAMCWGAYSVLVRRCMRGYSARLSFGVISLYTAPGLLAIMLALGDWRQLAHITPGGWFLLVLSSFMGIAFGHVLLYRVIHAVGPIIAEGGLFAIPFVTLVGARIFLGESMNVLEWVGGVAIVAGCYGLLLARKRVFALHRVAGSLG